MFGLGTKLKQWLGLQIGVQTPTPGAVVEIGDVAQPQNVVLNGILGITGGITGGIDLAKQVGWAGEVNVVAQGIVIAPVSTTSLSTDISIIDDNTLTGFYNGCWLDVTNSNGFTESRQISGISFSGPSNSITTIHVGTAFSRSPVAGSGINSTWRIRLPN